MTITMPLMIEHRTIPLGYNGSGRQVGLMLRFILNADLFSTRTYVGRIMPEGII